MTRYLAALLALLLCGAVFPREPITIPLAGDSTMSEKLPEKRPETGWGELLGRFFDPDAVRVVNHARNGRSTRTFLEEGRWEVLVASLKPGDYVFIQFGHNDQSQDKKDRYTPPEAYRRNLGRFVRDVRAKDATPVLLTPVVRRRFDAAGRFYDIHGEYPEIVRSVAADAGVALLDMHRKSEALLVRQGAEASKALFLWLAPGEHPNYPEGLEDNTHFSPRGARLMADLAVEGLRELGLGLEAYVRPVEGVTISVENPAEIVRTDEVVAVPWAALAGHLPAGTAAARVQVPSTGEVLPAQLLDADADGRTDELLFLASFRPGERRVFSVEHAAAPAEVAGRAHAAHHPARDDVVWENDRAAFRTYGEGLWALEELVSSGIDVWTKRVPRLVIDDWYARGDYHHDTGEGADFFKVEPALGAGGTALWRDGRLHRASNFAGHRIVAEGPLRAIVELDYGPWEAGGVNVRERKRIVIDAGSYVFRSESTFEAEGVEELTYATGLVKRPGAVAAASEAVGEGPGWTWLSLWGPLETAGGGHGDLGTAVLIERSRLGRLHESEDHYLALAPARPGVPNVHYAAAGWTAVPDFDSVEDWWAYLEAYAHRLAEPLRVEVEPPAGR